jgi:ComF family protein
VPRHAIARHLWSAANGALRLVVAAPCLACGAVLDRPLEGPVCGMCTRAIAALTPPFCARCGDPVASDATDAATCGRCRREPPIWSSARSAGLYEGPLRMMLQALKYERRRALARPLGALARRAGENVLADAAAVVPVPLHPTRAWQRGFNQSDDLAGELGLPVWRVLRRVRRGPPQVGLPAPARRANVAGAFALAHGVRWVPWRRRRLRGAVVVLVDDVMTTGSTLDACAGVLLEAGVGEVRALTVARALAARPPQSDPPPRPWAARRR